MAGVQASVTISPAVGAPGLTYDNGDLDVVSWIADVAIPFGLLVSQTVSGHCILPTATGHVTGFRTGVALIDPSAEASQTGYKIGDVVRVQIRGRVWVKTEVAFAVGDVVFARFATGTGTQLGAFRNAADTATCVAVPRCSLFQSGASGLAVIDLVAPGN